MAPSESCYLSRKNSSWRLWGLRDVLLGLLVTVVIPGGKLENMSSADPKVRISNWQGKATELSLKYASNGIVPKTVISSKLRMSVLVGLEGTGHLYLIQLVNDMFHTNDEISENTTPCISFEPYLTLTSMEMSTMTYARMLKKAKDEMHQLAILEKSLPWPGHLARLCMEMSYPTGHGAHKALYYMDLRLLVEIAEEEGIDIRVVYLKRSARDLIVANAVHRHFQNAIDLDVNTTSPNRRFSEYALMLLTDTAAMHSSLAEIDPAFIVCHDYSHAGEEEQALKIANFVAPNAIIADMYKTSLLKSWIEHPPKPENLPVDGAESIVARLQRKLDAFESGICK